MKTKTTIVIEFENSVPREFEDSARIILNDVVYVKRSEHALIDMVKNQLTPKFNEEDIRIRVDFDLLE